MVVVLCVNSSKKGPHSCDPALFPDSEVEAEAEVGYFVAVALGVGGSSIACTTNGNPDEGGKPAASAARGSGAGGPS